MSTILCVNALSSGEKFLDPPGWLWAKIIVLGFPR